MRAARGNNQRQQLAITYGNKRTHQQHRNSNSNTGNTSNVHLRRLLKQTLNEDEEARVGIVSVGNRICNSWGETLTLRQNMTTATTSCNSNTKNSNKDEDLRKQTDIKII